MIFLIGCGKGKKDGVHKAVDLYVGELFKKSVRIARKNNGKIYILSAKHGLIPEDKEICNYDETLNGKKNEEIKKWSDLVFSQFLSREFDHSEKIVFIAGNNYTKFLIPKISEEHYEVINLGGGLPIGKKLSYLKMLC